MFISGSEIFVLLFVSVIPFGLLIISLVDLMKREIKYNEKVLWALLIVLLFFIGPIVYFLASRKYPKSSNN